MHLLVLFEPLKHYSITYVHHLFVIQYQKQLFHSLKVFFQENNWGVFTVRHCAKYRSRSAFVLQKALTYLRKRWGDKRVFREK